MGVRYYYVNLTKREWLPIDALGGDVRIGAIGYTRSARVFELMLVDSPVPGRWCRDSITIVGDGGSEWLQMRDEYADITANAIVLFHADDGFAQLGQLAEYDERFFMELCHLVVTKQAPELELPLREKFGKAYLTRYKQLCTARTDFQPIDLVPVPVLPARRNLPISPDNSPSPQNP
jgi:hypothetical protein